MYPRTIELNGEDVLVADNQMEGHREQMMQDHRIVFISGVIDGTMDAQNLLLALDAINHEPIRLVITSPGGDLDTTFLFHDTMKLIQSPVDTVGRYCASAAAIILSGGRKRYLFPHAKVMLHLPAGNMGGDARDWDIQHKQMTSYKSKIVDILCANGATVSREQILNDIDRDFWLEPNEAISYGLADEVITPDTWHEFVKGDYK